MMLRIKFTRKWWNNFANILKKGSNNEVRNHLRHWTSLSFGRIKPTETNKFGALLLYDAQNKASKKRMV